jgi:anti-repressor protein
MNLTLWKHDEGFCPVYLTEKSTKCVNARELWKALGLKTQFGNWIKERITAHDLNDQKDFFTFQSKLKREDLNPSNPAQNGVFKEELKNPNTAQNGVFQLELKNPTGGRPTTEYILRLDTAKHIAMATMTEKGKEVRDYFLWCEEVKDAAMRYGERLASERNIPQTFAQALRLAADLAEEVEALKPKAAFYDAVTQSDDEIDMHEAAKVLNCGMGRNDLFARLRADGILMPNNTPYQRYTDAGYFRRVEYTFAGAGGEPRVGLKTVVSQRGLDFLRRKYAAQQAALQEAEA